MKVNVLRRCHLRSKVSSHGMDLWETGSQGLGPVYFQSSLNNLCDIDEGKTIYAILD